MTSFRSLRPITIAAIAFAPAAFSHSGPEKARAFYGGITRETRFYNLELVIDDGTLRLFVRDRHNWPEYRPDAKATAQLSGNQLAMDLTLLPGDQSALVAVGKFRKAEVQHAVITLSVPGSEPVVSEFDFKTEDALKLPVP